MLWKIIWKRLFYVNWTTEHLFYFYVKTRWHQNLFWVLIFTVNNIPQGFSVSTHYLDQQELYRKLPIFWSYLTIRWIEGWLALHANFMWNPFLQLLMKFNSIQLLTEVFDETKIFFIYSTFLKLIANVTNYNTIFKTIKCFKGFVWKKAW